MHPVSQPNAGPHITPSTRRPTVWARLGRALSYALWRGLGGALAVLTASALVAALIVIPPLIILRDVDPPGSMLMALRSVQGWEVRQTWVPLDAISPAVIEAVVMSEDSRFCQHRGIDLTELEIAYEKAEARGDDRVRGASTITMQVAKNLFLWPGRSFLRKGLEMPLALAIDALWTKRRTLEIYLNIAEWGPGIYGIEAAARHHFKTSAQRLTRREAAQLAAVLPNPIARDAARPGPATRRIADVVLRRMNGAKSYVRCLAA